MLVAPKPPAIASSPGSRYIAVAFPGPELPVDSPTASPMRHASRPRNVDLKPVATPAMDHRKTASDMPAFRPTRSTNRPTAGATSAYTTEESDTKPPYSAFVRCHTR